MTATSSGHGAVFRTRALGTSAELVVTDPQVVVAAARVLQDELDRIDRVASRFRPDSELMDLNRSAGRPCAVSEDLLEAVSVALRVARATGGAVDPTVGGAMRRLGYDRDFQAVAGGVGGSLPEPRPVPGWRSVVVDAEAGTLTLERGVHLDLGSTAKALAADRAAAEVADRFGCGSLVSLGGDVAVAGPHPEGFAVALADVSGDPGDGPEGGHGHGPGGGACTAPTVTVRAGGLATSGVAARHWMLGGRRVHHLVDPATGLPVAPCWRTVTVAAGTCIDANAASTAAMVKGAAAPAWLEALGLPARLVSLEGDEVLTGGWPASGPCPAAGRP